MFIMPDKERMNEIMKDIPKAIDVLWNKNGSHILRIKYAILLHKIAKELGIKYSTPITGSWNYIFGLINDNNIPNFAVLETVYGEYNISFGDDSEKDPIIAITRDFYEECADGYIYLFYSTEVSKRAIKCMRRCAICWYKNLITKDIVVFH